jgi:regulator of replication initiation timing
METPTISLITDCLVPMITAAAGWLAGKRKRRNDFLKNMQDSIDILSMENKRLIEDLTTVNREVVALRKENGELKYSVDQLCKENVQLKEEVRNLRTRITQAPA